MSTWIETVIGALFGIIAVGTFLIWIRTAWEMAGRDAGAGGFGMGTIGGERPGLLYGRTGIIGSAATIFGASVCAAIAAALWINAGTSWAAIVVSILIGTVAGASAPTGLNPE